MNFAWLHIGYWMMSQRCIWFYDDFMYLWKLHDAYWSPQFMNSFGMINKKFMRIPTCSWLIWLSFHLLWSSTLQAGMSGAMIFASWSWEGSNWDGFFLGKLRRFAFQYDPSISISSFLFQKNLRIQCKILPIEFQRHPPISLSHRWKTEKYECFHVSKVSGITAARSFSAEPQGGLGVQDQV